MTQKENNLMRKKGSKENNGDKPQNAYFLSLELENVRCFGEKQKVDFSDGNEKPRQWTIILGDNGTGKTTILQTLVYYFQHNKLINTYENLASEAESFAQRAKSLGDSKNDISNDIFRKKLAELKDVFSLNSKKLESTKAFRKETFDNISKTLFEKKALNGFVKFYFDKFENNCFAYGASRKSGEISLSERTEESAFITLFDEKALLLNPEEWLLQADYFVSRSSAKKSKENFRKVKEILISVLPDVDDIKISERNLKEEKSFPIPIVEFHTHYGWVEAKDLSLGYRTSMAWMVDFASRMFDLYPESENPLVEPAVVLIDEIDLHLHPKWQRDLLTWLSDLFPNTQFIVTTHSPLIVQSAVARDANIVVCRRESNHVVIDQSVEAVKNWRADQILTSDFFGLETARPKEIEKELLERQKILSKAKLTKRDENRLKELEENIGSMPVMENPKDDKAMDIIRRAAERLQSQK